MTEMIPPPGAAPAPKRQLPYPYDQDLSGVLRGLSRPGLANDPLTAAYLAAAVRLLQQHLGPGASRAPGCPDPASRPLLSFLSQRAIADEVSRNPPPFHRMGSVPSLRDRWPHQGDFVADVLRFGLWICHFPAAHYDETAGALAGVVSGPDPVGALGRLCYWDLARLLRTPMFRLGLVAAAEAEGDPAIGAAVAGRYRENSARWREHYGEFIRRRGLRLRPGIRLADCDVLLTALADGLALRALADPDAGVIDHGRQRSLLGTAAMIVAAATLECDGPAPGQSLEDAFRALLGMPPGPAGPDGPGGPGGPGGEQA
jgi:hypothetical protein